MKLTSIIKYIMGFLASFVLICGIMWGVIYYTLSARVSSSLSQIEVVADSTQAVGDSTQAVADTLSPLERQRLELAAKEARLDSLQKALDAQVRAYEQRADSLRVEMAQFNTLKGAFETQQIEYIAKVYGNMRPDKLAPILESLDEATIMHILSKMKEKDVSKVLSALPPAYAAKITQKLTNID